MYVHRSERGRAETFRLGARADELLLPCCAATRLWQAATMATHLLITSFCTRPPIPRTTAVGRTQAMCKVSKTRFPSTKSSWDALYIIRVDIRCLKYMNIYYIRGGVYQRTHLHTLSPAHGPLSHVPISRSKGCPDGRDSGTIGCDDRWGGSSGHVSVGVHSNALACRVCEGCAVRRTTAREAG